MRNKKGIGKIAIFGILLISIISLVLLVSALTPQEEILKLEQEIFSAGFDWLVDYNLDIPSIEVYNENFDEVIGEFNVSSSEISEYKIYPAYDNSDVYDLKFSGDISVDWIVDPTCPGGMSGSGTLGDECLIYNWTQLNSTRDGLSLSYKLMADLNSSSVGYSGLGDNWQPVGTGFPGLSGSFDGNLHTISNLTINLPDTDYVGFFSYVTGNVSNLNLNLDNLIGRGHVGGLTAVTQGDARLSNISVIIAGNFLATGTYVGGFAGVLNGISVSNCSVLINGNFTNSGMYSSGFTGQANFLTISQSFSKFLDSANFTTGTSEVGLFVDDLNFATIGTSYTGVYDPLYGDISFSTWNIGKTYPQNLLNYIFIENNSAYVNSSISSLNVSANVTLNLAGWNINTPVIKKDGVTCSAPNCNVLSYNTTTKIIVFNVSSWSNYSIGEGPLFAGGDGTSGNPYQITTWTQLNRTKLNLTAYYILMNDLSASDGDYAGLGDSWMPMGECSNYPTCSGAFLGNFDGNGKTISNLTINLPTTDHVGLFGYSNGNISNVNLVGANVIGLSATGSIVGFQNTGIISNSSATGTVTSQGYTGGLIGSQDNGTISNCSSWVNVNVNGSYIGGGLAGYSGGSILNSHSYGNVLGRTELGGLVGEAQETTIINCSAFGNVSGSSEVGGLVGYFLSGLISNSFASGNVSGSSGVGGLVGAQNDGVISDSSAFGSVNGSNYVAGLVGAQSAGTILNCYVRISDSQTLTANTSIVGLINAYYYSGPISNTYATVYDSQYGNITFLDWNVTKTDGGNLMDYIQIGNNSAYVNSSASTGLNKSANVTLIGLRTNYANPTILKDGVACGSSCYNFTSLNASTVIFNVSSWSNYSIGETPLFAGGDGTSGNPYQITSWRQLNNTRLNLTASYILMNNLNVNDSDYIGLGNAWIPITNGTVGYYFTGNFNGNNYNISNLTINLPSTDYVGLFGYANGGIISNLGLPNINITGHNQVGSLAGLINTGTIANCSSNGRIVGNSYVGGLAGSSGATIQDSYSSIILTASSTFAGGFVGDQSSATILRCYSSGVVSGVGYVGGLVGRQTTSLINNSYSTVNVSGNPANFYIGGLVGYQSGGTVANSFSTGSVSSGNNLGGLIGAQSGGTTINSYWDNQTSGRSTSAGGTGLTTAQMKTLSTFVNGGWNISSSITDLNTGYPYLGIQSGSSTSTWFIYVTPDYIYPTFSNYYDNNGTITNSGIGIFNVTLADTNGTVWLEINNVNVSVSNISNVFNTTYSFTNSGTYQYRWGAYGNGTNKNINYSEIRSYSVLGLNITNVIVINQTGSTGGTVVRGDNVTINATVVGATNVWVTVWQTVIGGPILLMQYLQNILGDLWSVTFATNSSFNIGQVNYTIYANNTLGVNASVNGTINVTSLFAGGNGTAGNPYQITSWTQLNRTKLNLTAYYILMNDLSASDGDYAGLGDSWIPIGTGSGVNSFLGSFDGNGKIISNLTINLPSTDYVGLFGYIGGSISNLNLSFVNVTGSNYVGSLVGYQNSGTISSNFVSGSILGSSYVGGLVGYARWTISSSSTSGNVTGSLQYVGGLAGYQFLGTISGSFSIASVNGPTRVGGLVGYSEAGTISHSFALGNVGGTGNTVGGLVGYSTSTILNSSAFGNVSGLSNVGGLVGYSLGSISNSSASGNVNGSVQYIGGLIGWQNSGTIFNCSAYGNINGSSSYVGGLVGYQNSGTIANSSAFGSISGLAYIGGLVGYSTGTILGNSAFGNVRGTGNYVGGLIAYQHSGTISNNFALGNISGIGTVGGLVGSSNGTISNSFTTGSVSGSGDNVGGLIGWQNSGITFNCSVSGNVTSSGNYAGGFVGYQFSGTISNSSVSGNLSGSWDAGGFVGWQDSGGLISNSSVLGSVYGSSYVGGFAGQSNGTISDSFVRIFDSQAISASGTNVGLITGSNGGIITNTYPTIYDSQYGNITFLDWNITKISGGNILDHIKINNNSAYVNSSASTGLNKSANITLLGIGNRGFTNPTILKDGSIDCIASGECYNFTPLNASTVIFNVTSWSNYSIGEGPLFAGGNGSVANPYQIISWIQLNRTKLNLTASYILMNNLSSSDSDYLGIGDNWQPIGDDITPFSGNFNGNNYNISNLTIYLPSTTYVGLFAHVAGNITNVNLVNINFTGWSYVGGLVGSQINGSIITGSSSSGVIYSYDAVAGGIVSYQDSAANISDSSASVSIQGLSQIGGLVGQSLGTITNCFAFGNMSGSNDVAGLVGWQQGGIIQNCSASGNSISLDNNVGGLVGTCYGLISQSSASGSVNGSNSYVGGLVGYFDGALLDDFVSISDSQILAASVSGLGLIVGEYSGGTFTEGIISNTYATVYDIQYGNITFLYWNVSKANGGNLMDYIQINNNSAYVDSSVSGLNVSANVTLIGIGDRGYTNPTILKDGVACGSSCYNFTALNASTVIFNVSSWSNYSIGEIPNPFALTDCGTISSPGVYTLQNNVSTTSTCFTITSNNVTLDLNGSSISGDGGVDDVGVAYTNNRNNISVLNGSISNFGYGLRGDYVSNSSFSSLNVNQIGYGYYSYDISYSEFENVNVTQISSEGIYLEDSHDLNLTNVIIRDLAGGAFSDGISLDPASNVTFYNLQSYNISGNELRIGGGENIILIYNNSFGSVEFYSLTGSINGDLRFGEEQNIQVRNDSVYLNITELGNLNRSANISLLNTNYSGEYPLLLRKVIKSGTECLESCSNLTSLAGSAVVFNVTDFGDGNISIGKFVRSRSEVALTPGWNMVSIQTENNDSSEDINVSLSVGWNLIGYSSEVNASLTSVDFVNSSGSNDTFTNSSKSGKLQKSVAYLAGSNTNSKKYSFVGKTGADAGLTKGKGYWVYANQSGNLTLPGVGGSAKNDSYKLNDLMFSNGTDELNITNAVGQGWTDGFVYYYCKSGEGIGCPGYKLVSVDRPSKSVSAWEGLFISSKKNNIQILRQN
jgi:hypothetical protein